MTPEESSFFDWAFKGMVGIILTGGGWLWARLMLRVARLVDDLADHKLEVAKNYATKQDVKETMQEFKATVLQINETVKRIHERIDGIFKIMPDKEG